MKYIKSFEELAPDKYVSVNHVIASRTKMTAGEASKKLKKLGINISAKELVNNFKILGRNPEWHHSGFYKSSKGSKMGKTYFFTDDDIIWYTEKHKEFNTPEYQTKIKEEIKKEEIKKESIIKGCYYTWDYDYNGKYGKKRNYKVLSTYIGPETTKPNNFTHLTDDEFEIAKSKEGKKYFGWDEPSKIDFQTL